jgi:hypothetical protein
MLLRHLHCRITTLVRIDRRVCGHPLARLIQRVAQVLRDMKLIEDEFVFRLDAFKSLAAQRILRIGNLGFYFTPFKSGA